MRQNFDRQRFNTIIFVPQNTQFNSQTYIDHVLRPLVEKYLPNLYENSLNSTFIHHDAAISHTSKLTQNYMLEIEKDTGIRFSRNSRIPIKSSDASPLNFFGFGCPNQRLRKRKCSNFSECAK